MEITTTIKQDLVRDFFRPVFDAVIFTGSSPYLQMVKKLYDIDKDYFEKIPAWMDQKPSELDFKLKNEILRDFNKLADQLLNHVNPSVVLGNMGGMADEVGFKDPCTYVQGRMNSRSLLRESNPSAAHPDKSNYNNS